MNLFGCLLPCSLKRNGWWGGADEATMGASASTSGVIGTLDGGTGAAVGDAFSGGAAARDRKKKATGFATLRKRLIRRRRSSKACDHGRALRELVADWSASELAALLEEYEALSALKDLSVQAELARPPAAKFERDLSALYDYECCSDADLVFRGARFPIHRALLSARCPYFRDLLAGCPGHGARICLELNRTASLDARAFSALLRYLYTGDARPRDADVDAELLRRLGDEFGAPNPLEHDLRYLLETGDYADAALVFTSDGADCRRPDSGGSEYGFRPKLELPCHKAILSARSPFFRNLIERRSRAGDDRTERASRAPTRIVLDERVIPKRYARVLLHAVYLDTVDLSLISRGGACVGGAPAGSLGEARALTHAGRARPSPLDEATELYQIGRFLELDILAQGCEDIIVEWLSLDTLAAILRWSSQPHGSAWVRRQALRFLREEFHLVVQSPVLYQLDKEHLVEVLRSDFLQASELEILQAVLKWGEQVLTRRMEDREPNLLSHTAHSVTRKGVKKRDLSDVELREILSDLFPLVRMDHVLPPNNEVLSQAIERGLVSTPPSHMIGDERENTRANAWIRSRNEDGLFVRPRLFTPYYDELKLLVEERAVHEVQRPRARRYVPDIPDTLYMVEDRPRSAAASGLDVPTAALPAPDPVTMVAMLKRVLKLKQMPICQRAIASPLSSRHEINRQIRLRVVREFNLPDPVAELLDDPELFRADERDDDRENTVPIERPPRPARMPYRGRDTTYPRYGTSRGDLPAVVPDTDSFRPAREPESSSCSDGHLSDIMPDVAMATAGFGQLQLQEPQELELDLGDGASRLHGALAPQAAASSNPFALEPTRAGRAPVACYRYLGDVGPPLDYYGLNRRSDGGPDSAPDPGYRSGPPRFL